MKLGRQQLRLGCAGNMFVIDSTWLISYGNKISCHLLHPFRSLFCLNPAGDTPSSARLFDAIVSGCIPVIVSDELELPFEGILDYRKVCSEFMFSIQIEGILDYCTMQNLYFYSFYHGNEHGLCRLTSQLVKLFDHH